MTTISAIEHDLSLRIPALVSLWRGTKNSGGLTSKELKTAGSALLSLQRGLTGSRQLAGAGYMDDNALLGAYLLYYWPVSYMQTALAASSNPQAFFSLQHRPLRILDLGAGPGPASCALSDLLRHMIPDAAETEFTLADSSGKALALAAKLLQYKAAEGYSVKVYTHTVNLERGIEGVPGTDTFDIIVVSHALNELWQGDSDRIAKRCALLEKAAERLSPEGVLFLSEPALLETSRSLLAVRDMIVSRGFTVLSPCLADGQCPALAAGPNHTCHAEVPWRPAEPVASLAKAAGLDRESVKMSFIIAGKRTPDTETAAEPEKNRAGETVIARVVSDAMLNKSGRIRFLLCDGHTRFAFSAKNGDPAAGPAGFFALRRYDLIELTSPEIRGNGGNTAYGFGKDTKLHVVSRIGSN